MMLCVKIAQLLLVWSQRSLSDAPSRPTPCPKSAPMLVKPLLVNTGALNGIVTTASAGRRANALSVVILPMFAGVSGSVSRNERTPLATGVLKQVGEAPGARIAEPIA